MPLANVRRAAGKVELRARGIAVMRELRKPIKQIRQLAVDRLFFYSFLDESGLREGSVSCN